MRFLDSVQIAKAAMRELFPTTPLQRNEFLSKKYEADIYLKREDLSPVRSYKIRGAFNSMRKIKAKNQFASNFVCASAGNHAQGVAFACKHFNVKGYIFMPVTTPKQKIDKTIAFGGENIEIKLIGDYFDKTLKSAIQFCKEESAEFLSPFDSISVIEGQATVMAELVEQMRLLGSPDMVLLAVGGGGLSSGMTKYANLLKLNTKFRLIEPEGAASLTSALSKGRQVTLKNVNNFVDGAAVARIGDKNFEILKKHPKNHVILAPEDRVCATMLEMLNVEGIVLEPAGALSIDALNDIPKNEILGKRIVCIVSGGNFDFERLPDVKERALRFSGKKKYIILRMPQRPGALREFLSLLGPNDDIARFEYLKKSARNFGSVLLGIETTEDQNFDRLFSQMNKAGFSYQDITNNEALNEFIV